MWGSWLAAHTGGDGAVGIWGTPFLAMMEHCSEMPKLSLTRAIPGNGTNPCHAKSASGVNQGVEEILKENLGCAQPQNPWAECWEADSTHC